MGVYTEEVCKNVQKTIKNSTFLSNFSAIFFYGGVGNDVILASSMKHGGMAGSSAKSPS